MRQHRPKTLRNICLPGSHQSATYTVESTERRLPLAIGWTRCQRFDISEQLDAGVRFLDVSVSSANDDKDGEVSESELTAISLTRSRFIGQHLSDAYHVTLQP